MPLAADFVGGLHLAAKRAGIEKLAAADGFDGKVGEAVVHPLGGAVEDFPFDEAAVAAEPDGAAADAAEREGDLSGFGAGVGKAWFHGR